MALDIDALVERTVKSSLTRSSLDLGRFLLTKLGIELAIAGRPYIMVRQKTTKQGNNADTPAWDDRFIDILKRDYKNLDNVIAAILEN